MGNAKSTWINTDSDQKTVSNAPTISTPPRRRRRTMPVNPEETDVSTYKATWVNPHTQSEDVTRSEEYRGAHSRRNNTSTPGRSSATIVNPKNDQLVQQIKKSTWLNGRDTKSSDSQRSAPSTYINSGVTEDTPLIERGSNDLQYIDLKMGTVLEAVDSNNNRTNTYFVESRIGKAEDNGESDVFRCTALTGPYRNYACVVKVYRRPRDPDYSLLNTLKTNISNYVVMLWDFGFVQDRYFEIYPYLAFGSLEDEIKTHSFSENELRNIIIPQLNEALHSLHKKGILHRDIKPSNILWTSSQKKQIALIDFGLSVKIDDRDAETPTHRNTIYTKELIGLTPVYAAPETAIKYGDGGQLYSVVSDYWSMGIVLYELFCKKLPFTSEEILVATVTKPGNMSQDLYDLIRGLTFVDIRNRKDQTNPQRRWCYDEVKNWLSGGKYIVPGITNRDGNNGARSVIIFNGQEFSDINKFCATLALNWIDPEAEVEGFIVRGSLKRQLDRLPEDKLTAPIQRMYAIMDECMTKYSNNATLCVLKFLQQMTGFRDYFACKMNIYKDIGDFGNDLISKLKNNRNINLVKESVSLLLQERILSSYAKDHHYGSNEIQQIEVFESWRDKSEWTIFQDSYIWAMAYCFSGDNILDPNLPGGITFSGIDELKRFLLAHAGGDYSDLYTVCSNFLTSSNVMTPQVFGWLYRMGVDMERSGFNGFSRKEIV